jgi:plasmid stabilization system protein ParE
MMRVRLSPRAERFLLKALANIAEDSPNTALKIIERLERKKSLLGSFPKMTERGLLPETRKIHASPFILTARVRRDTVEILAIRFARQGDALAPDDVQTDDLDRQ